MTGIGLDRALQQRNFFRPVSNLFELYSFKYYNRRTIYTHFTNADMSGNNKNAVQGPNPSKPEAQQFVTLHDGRLVRYSSSKSEIPACISVRDEDTRTLIPGREYRDKPFMQECLHLPV